MVFGPKQNPPSFLQTPHFGPPSHSSGVSPEPWCITYLLCFSCMAVSESQGSKGEIKQKLFKVWQGLESQNSLRSLQPSTEAPSNKGEVCYKLKKKRRVKKMHERGLLGFSWPFKPLEKKMFKIFNSWTSLHTQGSTCKRLACSKNTRITWVLLQCAGHRHAYNIYRS